MKTLARIIIGRLLVCVLVINGLVGFFPVATRAQNGEKRAVVINADQPNVWTLEQAHYLLAQMHRRNLDLKAKSLEDLDPNEINGLNFSVLRQLVELGVKFDQKDLENNKSALENREFNNERRQSLIRQNDQLREESLKLSGEISDLELRKTQAGTEEEKDQLTAQINAKTSRLTRVDKERDSITAELKNMPAPSTDLQSTQAQGGGFNDDKLPKSTFDEPFKAAVTSQINKFNEAPKLNSSLRLDNFLQMQYEIIAKQLTLLRDEVGPGERLIFLELPQTINSTYSKADKKWAQSWWKIRGYTRKPKEQKDKSEEEEKGLDLRQGNPRSITTAEKIENIVTALGGTVKTKSTNDVEYVELDSSAGAAINAIENGKPRNVPIDLRSKVRTVDLIPRQSSLNVNDMNLKVKAGALSIVTSFLFGLGANLNAQRKQEQFSQFVQQELYSAAFGKGSREFGWTFTPMPGTDRLMSGVRTTYAVVVVPREATSIVMESNGCYFPRSEYQPNNFADTVMSERWSRSRKNLGCGESKAFIVPVPVDNEGSNSFWVEGISYQPVAKGKRITVLISGENFSSQLGILVNGIPLRQAIGLAQPLIQDDSKAGTAAENALKDEKIKGRIERVDSEKIVASFTMPEDFEGTPTITLITPGRAVDLNWLKIKINGHKEKTTLLAAGVEPMFKGDWAPPLRIDSVEVFPTSGAGATVIITGAGFNKSEDEIFINGVQISKTPKNPIRSASLIVAENVNGLTDGKIQVILSSGDKTIKFTPAARP